MFGEVNRAIEPPAAHRHEVVERRSHWRAGIDQVAARAFEQRVERKHLDPGRGGFGAPERYFCDVHRAARSPHSSKQVSVFDYNVSPRPLGRTTAST